MSIDDLQRVRFDRSPLTETAESLWILLSGRVQPAHRGWHARVNGQLAGVDLDLLRMIVPGTGAGLADFLLPTEAASTMDHQLQAVAELPTERLAANLHRLWPGGLPEPAGSLLADAAGPRRIAEALRRYWTVAVAPFWDRMRAVIDEDIAYRATTLTRCGVAAMFDGLHPKIHLTGEVLRLDIAHSGDRQLTGAGMRLVPSVFAWPFIVVDVGTTSPNCLVYPARGVGDLWHHDTPPQPDDPLAELLGRTRAAILTAVAAPNSTTALARQLGQSAPAISQHLSILRRSGLVTSWRSGRSVYYRQTPLGRSVAGAGAGSGAGAGPPG
jgi:DNA-binding transcriptional ArsR family regulator